MRSLKRGEKVHAPLATGCGQSSARRLEEGARHGGHRGRSPGVPVPLRAGGRLLPPKGTRPSDLGGASAAESLNCARPPPPPPPSAPYALPRGDRTPKHRDPNSLSRSLSRTRASFGMHRGGWRRSSSKAALRSKGCCAGHHVHILPASGREGGLWVASLGGRSSPAFQSSPTPYACPLSCDLGNSALLYGFKTFSFTK